MHSPEVLRVSHWAGETTSGATRGRFAGGSACTPAGIVAHISPLAKQKRRKQQLSLTPDDRRWKQGKDLESESEDAY